MFAESGRHLDLNWNNRLLCLEENGTASSYDRHYIYHTAWAARILSEIAPESHTDISSSLYFSTIVSAFIPVHFYDYRPARVELNNFTSAQADLLSLPFPDTSVRSLSCMHVVEHIGLGRYGDPLDPDGDLKAIAELKRVLADNGDLLFVVPIGGVPHIVFNAHRIYSYGQIRDIFSDMELVEFALVPDDPRDGGLVSDAPQELLASTRYGCGCFWFRKPPAAPVGNHQHDKL